MLPRTVGVEPINHVPAEIPTTAKVMATILSLLTMSVLAVCFSLFPPTIVGMFLIICSKEISSNKRLV